MGTRINLVHSFITHFLMTLTCDSTNPPSYDIYFQRLSTETAILVPSSPGKITALRNAHSHHLEQWWAQAKRHVFRSWSYLLNSPTGIFLVTKTVQTPRYALCLSKGAPGEVTAIRVHGERTIPQKTEDVILSTKGTQWLPIRNELAFEMEDSRGRGQYSIFIERDSSKMFALTDVSLKDAAEKLWKYHSHPAELTSRESTSWGGGPGNAPADPAPPVAPNPQHIQQVQQEAQQFQAPLPQQFTLPHPGANTWAGPWPAANPIAPPFWPGNQPSATSPPPISKFPNYGVFAAGGSQTAPMGGALQFQQQAMHPMGGMPMMQMPTALAEQPAPPKPKNRTRPGWKPVYDGKDRLILGDGWFLIRGADSYFLELAGTGLDVPPSDISIPSCQPN